MNRTEQLKLIEIETPREAAERRHQEYVARFRQEQAVARRKGLENRRREKLRRAQNTEASHDIRCGG
jgi:hypothetical protein